MTTTIEPQTAGAAAKIEETLLAFCRRNGLFAPGNRVIAACSGGADSMALLLFLLRRGGELGIVLEAAHVNHGIRGAEADADADFVARFCQTNGVPLHLFDAAAEGVSIPSQPGEDWARRLRYDYFDRLAAQRTAMVATAHTLSDQMETVLFRLARGSGLHGAAGIPLRRGVYVRPCLCLTRAQTAGYCTACGQSYREDATNHGDRYARNRIRHYAVPALLAANPGAEQAFGRFCGQAAQLDGWLQGKAEALLAQAAAEGCDGCYRLAVLQNAQTIDAPVLDRALHLLVSPVRDAEERYIALLRELVCRGSGAVQLSASVRWVAGGGLLRMETLPEEKTAPGAPQSFTAPGEYRLPGGYLLRAALQKYEDFLKNRQNSKKDSNCYADYAKIQKNALLRTRLPGDVFAPAGRGCRKTLKKLLNEAGVPPGQRTLLPLLAVGNEVLWLWGFGFAQGLAPEKGTDLVLALEAHTTGEDDSNV